MPYAKCPDCKAEMHYRGKPGLPFPPPCKMVRENVGGPCIWPENAPNESTETVVVNIHRDKDLIAQARAEGRYVYIGRPSGRHNQWGFGNPFSYKNDTKAMVVVDNPLTAFRQWLLGESHTALMQEERRWILQQLPMLRGYVLGCFCRPSPCHGDVLKDLIDEGETVKEILETMHNDGNKSLNGETPAAKEKKEIRALTLWQPWAWLIIRPDVTGPGRRRLVYDQGQMKAIENRSWPPPDYMIDQYIAIHAGKTYDADCEPWLAESGLWVPNIPDRSEITSGAIVGIARILKVFDDETDVPAAQLPWYFGPYGWLLDVPEPIDPVPCRGYQGLWKMPEDVYKQVRANYAKAKKAWADEVPT